MEKKSIFENPILSTKVKSANVKLPEMLFGYFLGPFGALLASGIFTSFLNRYWTDILFANYKTDGVLPQSITTFLTLLPLLSAILIVAGNLVAGQLIEPEERLKREEEEANRIADEARKAELKAKCEKKGLSFEEEEVKYQAKLEAKKKLAEEKQAKNKNKDKE